MPGAADAAAALGCPRRQLVAVGVDKDRNADEGPAAAMRSASARANRQGGQLTFRPDLEPLPHDSRLCRTLTPCRAIRSAVA